MNVLRVHGRYRTRSLFWEYRREGYDYLFTLKDHDYNNGRSLNHIFLELDDPTEYKIASEIFVSLQHWKELSNLEWFRPFLEKWRDELEIRIRAEALLNLRKQSKISTSAAQFLSKGAWMMSRGRPSKAEKERIMKKEILIHEEADELLLRATQGNA